MPHDDDVATTVARLLASPARTDLHHFVRIDPFNNAARRRLDTGWSCREHAVLFAALLAAEGIASDFVYGANIFVMGPSPSGAAPYGIGNDAPDSVRGHSWLQVAGFGVVDISPRLNERFPALPQWRPIRAEVGRIGDAWLVDGAPARVMEPTNFADYGAEIAMATHVVDGHTAIYWEQERLPFSMKMLDADWIDSPLRTRAKASNFDDAILLLATHLWAVNQERRKPLATVSQAKAWRIVSEIDEALVAEFRLAIDQASSASQDLTRSSDGR